MTQTNSATGRESTEVRSFVAKLARSSARHWKLTFVVWGAVVVVGAFAWFSGLAREGFPPVNLPIVVVDGTFFAGDVDAVDQDVTVPLQVAFSDVANVESVLSFARANSFALVVEFDGAVTSGDGADRLSAAIEQVLLPPAAVVTVRPLDATKFVELFDVLIAVSGPPGTSPDVLQAAAAELAAHMAESPDIEVASVRELLTEGTNPATGAEETRRTRFTRVAYEGSTEFQEAITVGLVRSGAADQDVLEFSDSVHATLASAQLPNGLSAEVTADFAPEIRSQISGLSGSLLTGLIAVALVSLALIGWRVAVITAMFMATVMSAALVGLWVAGYSLNTITMFGLILTLGLLVDDAIVISESIDSSRDEADDPVAVVAVATQHVGSASMAGTLTTVLVFTPMLFVGGVLGEFIRAIPATVIITLLLSFVFSITFIPAISRKLLLAGPPASNPIVRAERRAADALGRLAMYPAGNGAKGWLVGGGLLAAAVVSIAASFGVASRVGFNIFPPTKDSNGIQLSVDFDPNTTIESAQQTAVEIDAAVLAVLGDDLVRSQYLFGNERGLFSIIDLVHFDDRSTTSPDYAGQLEASMAEIPGVRISVSPLENGPPVDDFPFTVQISVSPDQVEAGEILAAEIAAGIKGVELDKNGDQTFVADTFVSTSGQVSRTDGGRIIEVAASFTTDDTTSNLTATEDLVRNLFAPSLVDRGLGAEALAFDFGQESDNQDDFASLGQAFVVALGLMALLLITQFRSVVQPALIFLAIPFSFLGVFSILLWSDNSLSFFVMVGFIALIGVVVNNTILLIDAANQARRRGLIPAEAIGEAVAKRARPLVATTVTTIAGLLPLALSDPFWEALSFTLIGGLLSSTVTVLLAFPVVYLVVEKARRWLRNRVRSRFDRALVP